MKKIIYTSLFLSIFLISNQIHAQSHFSDLKGHWSQDYVEKSFKKGIVKGYADGTFRPDAPVTFAESLSLVTKAGPRSAIFQKFSTEHKFDNWYQPLLDTYASLDKTNEKVFKTNEAISRDMAVYLLLRQLGISFNKTDFNKIPNNFPDVNKNTKFAPYIAFAGYVGISNGYADSGKFGGNNGVTRGQLAKMAYLSLVENSDTIVQKYEQLIHKDVSKVAISNIKKTDITNHLYGEDNKVGDKKNNKKEFINGVYQGDNFQESDFAKDLVKRGAISFDSDGNIIGVLSYDKTKPKGQRLLMSAAERRLLYTTAKFKANSDIYNNSLGLNNGSTGVKAFFAWMTGNTYYSLHKDRNTAIKGAGKGFDGSLPMYLFPKFDGVKTKVSGIGFGMQLTPEEKAHFGIDKKKYPNLIKAYGDRMKRDVVQVDSKILTDEFYHAMLDKGFSGKDWKIIDGMITYLPSKLNHKLLTDAKDPHSKKIHVGHDREYNQKYFYAFTVNSNNIGALKHSGSYDSTDFRVRKQSEKAGQSFKEPMSYGMELNFHMYLMNYIING